MLEISPVLAGTFDQPDYAPAATNIGSQATEDAYGVDSRRYTQFDRSAADSGKADFSFDDLLDMLNPLEHIPVISAAYREITGDKINAVARVAGDIIYGGLAGGASALVGGIGAIADEVMQAKTGKPAMTYVADALFGSGNAASTEVADAAATTLPPPAVAAAVTVANTATTISPSTTAAPTPANMATSLPMPPPTTGAIPLASTAPTSLTGTKSFPLTPNKLPYGGVMDTSANNPNIARAQDMAIALSQASPTGLRLGHTIYTKGLMSSVNQSPQTNYPLALAAAPVTTANGGNNAGQNTQQNNAQLPQGLMNDIAALKALNLYKNTASAPAGTGSALDITN